MRVLLLAGGWSSERDVSLRGAEQIKKALNGRGHEVTVFDIRSDFERLYHAAQRHDAAFINMHGSPGEDGLIQAILDRAGCPYQGSGPAGSFLALHKAAAKQLFRAAGLQTPDWIFLPERPDPGWEPHLPYPLFVKANTGGSSLHLFRTTCRDELAAALDALFAIGKEALVETAVPGREVTCGVLGDQVLPPVLIRPPGIFFDYRSKYDLGGAEEVCPAPLPQPVLETVQAMTLAAHEALGLSGCSRADFILRDDGSLFVLEINTLPGLTQTSLLPREVAAMGMSFDMFIERLLQDAMFSRVHRQMAGM
jgi:D-alanine-D-alanine ligase